MSRISVTRTIDAPSEIVFDTVADIRQFSKALPHVVKYEFQSEVQSGVGTRFRERRLMNGKEATTELELTEFVENDRVRLVADDGYGTVWDTLFTVKAENGSTVLTMTMDAKSYKWLAKIIVFFIKAMVRRAVERDLDFVKAFCEKTTADPTNGG
jgi:carbon monoxide dehydrogenase subunit G